MSQENINFIIEQNIISFLKEQLYVLGKEYEYIYLIANFYAGNHNKDTEFKSHKADLEKNFLSIKSLIMDENDKLISLNTYLGNNLIDIVDTQKDDIVNILMHIDYARKEINKLINKFEKINEKLIQMLRDGYNQYIPKPIIGKRHSNINIISQLELKINKSKNLDKSKEFFITWKFSHSYQVLDLNKNKTMINLSYWIFDTPYLMPIITHEIVHKKINEFSNLQGIIYNIVDSNKEMSNRADIFKFHNNKKVMTSIVEDITIDIISFLKHGNSYILAIATSFLGYYFANTFKYDKDNNSFNITHWEYMHKRDLAILRLLILVSISKEIRNIELLSEHKKFKQNILYIEHINNSLTKLYFDENKGFQKIYNNYHNYKKDFMMIINLIQSIKKDIIASVNLKDELQSIFEKEFNNEKEFNKKELPFTLNQIWENRLNYKKFFQVPNNIEYRKKIHYETLIKLKEDGYLSSFDVIQPYQITFIKTKLPEKKDEKFDYLDFNSIQKDKYYNTLGIYDFMKIKSPNKKINLEGDILKNIGNKKQHYKSFLSLMKIMDDINGKNEKKEFNAVIQIEVEKNLRTENIKDTYDNLYNDLVEVKSIFQDKSLEKIKKIKWLSISRKSTLRDYNYYFTEFFKKDISVKEFERIEFYKSLGPKDIVLVIYNCSIDFIYKVKKNIAEKSSLKRSYTTIFYDKEEKPTLKINDKYNFVSEIRANNIHKDNEDDIEKYLKSDDFKESLIHKVAGVMDYKIIWNHKIDFDEINKTYDKLIKKGFIQDLQTMISQKL